MSLVFDGGVVFFFFFSFFPVEQGLANLNRMDPLFAWMHTESKAHERLTGSACT